MVLDISSSTKWNKSPRRIDLKYVEVHRQLFSNRQITNLACYVEVIRLFVLISHLNASSYLTVYRNILRTYVNVNRDKGPLTFCLCVYRCKYCY